MPYLFRKVNGSEYSLVGETYVDGIMFGEPLEANRDLLRAEIDVV